MIKVIKSFGRFFCILSALIVCAVICGFFDTSVNNTAEPKSFTLTDTIHDSAETKLAYEDIQKNGDPVFSPNVKGRTEDIIKSLRNIKDVEIAAFSEDKKVFVNLSLADKTRLPESEENTIKTIVSLEYRIITSADVIIQYT